MATLPNFVATPEVQSDSFLLVDQTVDPAQTLVEVRTKPQVAGGLGSVGFITLSDLVAYIVATAKGQ